MVSNLKYFTEMFFRGYLPEPGIVAVEFQSQLRDNLGIDVEVVVMESGEFIDESTNGRLDGFYLLGWGADYPHVTNFLDFHFSASNPQYGDVSRRHLWIIGSGVYDCRRVNGSTFVYSC